MDADRIILRNSAIFSGVIIATTVLVFVFHPSPVLIKIVSDVFPLFLSLAGALLAYSIFRRQVKTHLGRRIWGAMTLGLLLWAIGEAIWTFYELVLKQETPYPSLADVIWTVGYIPLILSLAYQYLPLRTSVSRSRRLLVLAIVAVMIVLIFGLVVLPMLTDPEAGTPAEMFFNLAYPVGDIVLISFAIALVAAFLGGELARSWGLIAVGILLLSIADLLFSYGNWHGLYYPDGQFNFFSGLFDTLYIGAYVVWTAGLYRRLRLPESGSDLDARLIEPEKKGKLADSELLGRIVENAQAQGANPLAVYVNAVVGLLDNLVEHAGGGNVETAFDTVINGKARELGCGFEIRAGRTSWKDSSPDAGACAAILEEAVRYSKTVVATETIDRNLREIERHMPSRIVQAAEENRLRMVRWLDEKPG